MELQKQELEFKATILFNSMKSQRVKFIISTTDILIKGNKDESQNLFKILADKLH